MADVWPASAQTTQPFQGHKTMKKLLAAMIAASFACGVAYAADPKKEEKKPTAEECKKDPKMKGCEPAKK
jgi:hypothetical protein